jgi:hypothetical protein
LDAASDVSAAGQPEDQKNLHFLKKNHFLRLTVIFRWLRCRPRLKRDSGSRKTKELVLAYFGTANWNSILSRHDEIPAWAG